MQKRKVLITGVAGRVGRVLVKGLDRQFLLSGFDRSPAQECAEFTQGDIADIELLTETAAGMDAMIHLAGTPDPAASWDLVLPSNIVGTRNAMEAAHRAGVKRFIFASRAGLVSQYPDNLTRSVDFKPCPTDIYSVSKCFGESLGYHYSVTHGMEVVCVRIGNFTPQRSVPVHPHQISEEDLVQVFERCLLQEGVRFEIVFAVSDSTYTLYDLDHGRDSMGYYPKHKSRWSRFRFVRALRKIIKD